MYAYLYGIVILKRNENSFWDKNDSVGLDLYIFVVPIKN